MPRIAPRAEPFPPEIQAHFDAVMPPGVPPLVLFTTLAKSERAWRKFRSGSLLDGKLLSLRERELVINRTCARAGCEYEWGVHIAAFARAANLTNSEIAATIENPIDLTSWPANEAVLLASVDALHDHATLTDPEFAALRSHYSEEQILEILLLAGFYRTVSYLANGLDLPLEATAARFADYAPD